MLPSAERALEAVEITSAKPGRDGTPCRPAGERSEAVGLTRAQRATVGEADSFPYKLRRYARRLPMVFAPDGTECRHYQPRCDFHTVAQTKGRNPAGY